MKCETGKQFEFFRFAFGISRLMLEVLKVNKHFTTISVYLFTKLNMSTKRENNSRNDRKHNKEINTYISDNLRNFSAYTWHYWNFPTVSSGISIYHFGRNRFR